MYADNRRWMPPGWIPPKGTPAGAPPAPHAGAAGAGRAEREDEVKRTHRGHRGTGTHRGTGAHQGTGAHRGTPGHADNGRWMPPGWIPPKGTPAGAPPAPHAGAAGAGRAEGEDEVERKEGGKEVDGERTENKVRRRVFPQWEMMPPGWIPPKGTPAGALPAPHAGAAGAGRAEGEDEVERKGGGKEVELWPKPQVGRPVSLTRSNEAASPQPQQPNSDPKSYAEYLQQRDRDKVDL